VHGVDEILRYAWGQYRVWAATSWALKKQVDRWAAVVLVLTIAGTALGTMGPFLDAGSPLASVLPWAAAIALGIATYFTTQLLSASAREAWVKARAVAEAVKSESYKYATRTAPYAGADAAHMLRQKVNELLPMASGILAESVSDDDRVKSAPSGPWTIVDYIQGRLHDQITYYRRAIDRHRRAVRIARLIALVLGVVAVVLSASAAGQSDPKPSTWVAALLGTVTTAAASIAAWFQSGNHLQNALNYQAAVAKLESLLAQHAASSDDQRLVLEAEAVFQSEHASWLAQWQSSAPRESERAPTRPSAPGDEKK
jgi:tetratricopeptide (TPR) repeat protein